MLVAMTTTQGLWLAVVVLSVLLAIAVGRLFWHDVDAVDALKDDCADAATICEAEGHKEVAFILTQFSRAKVAAGVQAFKSLLHRLRNSEDRAAVFDKQFKLQLANRLKDPDKRAEILAAVADVAKVGAAATTVAVPEAAPAAVVSAAAAEAIALLAKRAAEAPEAAPAAKPA